MRAEVASLGDAFTPSVRNNAPSISLWLRGRRSICFELLHGLARLFFVSSELFHNIALFDSQAAHKALISGDVVHVKIDLLLQHNQLLFHLYLQTVSRCLDFGLHLDHLFFLYTDKKERFRDNE